MQSYQRFQHVDHMAFNTSGTNGPRSLFRMKAGTHSPSPAGAHTAAHRAKQGRFSEECREPAGQRCVHARRCPEASRPRWDALLCCWFLRYTGKLRGSLSLHPRAERKICCWGCLVFACGIGDSSLVTAVPFLNRCLRRSMRGTCLSERRSDCRF